MRTTAAAGIVFANSNDNLLRNLTSQRSMASVPFGARYRLIDFSLSNLVNAGIIPFTFKNEADYDKISVNDELCLPEIRDVISNGKTAVLKNKTTGEEYELDYQLSERQVQIILAGGLLDYTRENS